MRLLTVQRYRFSLLHSKQHLLFFFFGLFLALWLPSPLFLNLASVLLNFFIYVVFLSTAKNVRDHFE